MKRKFMYKFNAISVTTVVKTSGFTLVELLVATAIVMVVFLAGLVVLSSTNDLRRQTMARIRASENARMFFQLLERDFAGAYPTTLVMKNDLICPPPQNPRLPGYTVPIFPPPAAPGGTIDTDYLQFYTRTDYNASLDDYIFARYYVNDLEQLCREVNNDLDINNPNPRPDPWPPTPSLPLSGTTSATNSTFALFDEVRSLTFSYDKWDDQNKKFESFVPAANATHLSVKLTLFERSVKKSNAPKTDPSVINRIFEKRLPIPSAF